MPRLPYFGALLAVATLWSSPLSAQKSAPNHALNGARVQHVVVRGTPDAMEVEIQTSGAPVTPDTQAITGPDRIVVDFPGALPAAELRAFEVHRGALKAIRSGLFFSNPAITRVVLDLTEPQSYRISTTQNAIVVKLGPANLGTAKMGDAKPELIPAASAPAARLYNASLAPDAHLSTAELSTAVATESAPPPASEATPAPPAVTVTFENGMLGIRADKATLAQVLFEVQRRTQAEIAIPAGAEQEKVAAELGPGPARDVLAALLNGSPYNFIFVGSELKLERVILSRRDPSPF